MPYIYFEISRYICTIKLTYQMKKGLPLITALLLLHSAFAQDVVFEDGTTVHLNHASFDYENIRRASAGIVTNYDGFAGIKSVSASYLKPEKFFICANAGFSSASVEATYFFTGETKLRKKHFTLKYRNEGTYKTKAYVLKQDVRKRKEKGLYFAINNYGGIWNDPYNSFDNFTYTKATQLFAGFSSVNYWHADINVDNNILKRAQFTGRTIIAPFIITGAVADTLGYTEDVIPKYGARVMYELSNTFGFRGASIRGRTNLVIRIGTDISYRKNKTIAYMLIFGGGVVYNFGEGKNRLF